MIPRLTALALTLFAGIAALPAHAQNVRPGLWEMSNKVQSDNPQMAQAMERMKKELAAMPPEQRKAMEEMMAKHGGVKLDPSADGGMVLKMCLTKEMIQEALFSTPPSSNCTHKKTPLVGNTMSYSFNCTNPQSSGEGTVKFSSDTAFTSRTQVTSSQNGKKEVITMDASSRWLGADCGNIKPLNLKPQPAPKPAAK